MKTKAANIRLKARKTKKSRPRRYYTEMQTYAAYDTALADAKKRQAADSMTPPLEVIKLRYKLSSPLTRAIYRQLSTNAA